MSVSPFRVAVLVLAFTTSVAHAQTVVPTTVTAGQDMADAWKRAICLHYTSLEKFGRYLQSTLKPAENPNAIAKIGRTVSDLSSVARNTDRRFTVDEMRDQSMVGAPDPTTQAGLTRLATARANVAALMVQLQGLINDPTLLVDAEVAYWQKPADVGNLAAITDTPRSPKEVGTYMSVEKGASLYDMFGVYGSMDQSILKQKTTKIAGQSEVK